MLISAVARGKARIFLEVRETVLTLGMVLCAGILLVPKEVMGASELQIWAQTVPPRLLRTVPIEKGEGFTVTWEHSVEHFQWRETFQITADGRVRLLRSSTQGYGAGTPDRQREGGSFRIEQGWLVYEPVGLELEALPISLSPLSPHWLESGAVRLSLLEIAGEQAILLRPRRGVSANHP